MNLLRTSLMIVCLILAVPASAQLGGMLKKAKKKVEERTEEKVDEKVDKQLDKIFNENQEESSQQAPATQTAAPSTGSTAADAATTSAGASGTAAAARTGVLSWSKFDFVPGDVVIFEDNLEGEENGEFPSRWDLARGVVEVAELDGENVIMLRGGSPCIVPYLENSDKDYLPEVFTVEYDLYMGGTGGWTELYLWDNKNQERGSGNQYRLQVRYNQMSVSGSQSNYPDRNVPRNRWIHVAVAYTSGKFKAYMDDTRLINIPRLDFNPSGISLYSYHASDNNPIFFKNIRIAEGGVKYYDRVLQDGKIVANGIRFDVGKASLRPESMGVINEVVGLMKEHEDLNFSVEGHTDSDGDADMNLELSQKRAEAVMATMVSLGIDQDRLQAKGMGETAPVSNNTTAEGKANNRRVEFVKL